MEVCKVKSNSEAYFYSVGSQGVRHNLVSQPILNQASQTPMSPLSLEKADSSYKIGFKKA